MRKLAPFALALVAAPAHADDRIDLAQVPDLAMFEAAWPLDRSYADHSPRLGMTIGLGAGATDDDTHAAGVAGLVVGYDGRSLLAAGRSELTAAGTHVERGRHRALVLGRNDTGSLTLAGALDHGDALAIAPVHLGPGRRIDAGATAEALVLLRDKGDAAPAGSLTVETGTTRWYDAGPERADRRAVALALSIAPTDGELPRGKLDLIRGRVERTRITPRLGPTFARGGAAGGTEVRVVEIGSGANELTLHVDREVASVIVADLGWSWLESEGPSGKLADNMFRMRLATATRWRRDDRVSSIGFAFARVPGHTPDGSRLVADWRLELSTERTTKRLAFGARGVLSWITPIAGGEAADTLLRYGAHGDAFYRVGGGVELGVYHAVHREPRVAGDPWATSQRWGTEAGVLVRWRRDPARAREPLVHSCGGVVDDLPDAPIEEEDSAVDPEATPVEDPTNELDEPEPLRLVR